MRRRLQWVADHIPDPPLRRLLEVGYGSGIFMVELADRVVELHGIDVHSQARDVRRRLRRVGVSASLVRGSGVALPYRDESFDAVVVVSALEFMDDPRQCLKETLRVVRAGAPVICLTPRVRRWADTLYRVLVGFDPESEFRGGRHRVQQALDETELPLERFLRPRRCPASIAPYEVAVLRRPVHTPVRAVPAWRARTPPGPLATHRP